MTTARHIIKNKNCQHQSRQLCCEKLFLKIGQTPLTKLISGQVWPHLRIFDENCLLGLAPNPCCGIRLIIKSTHSRRPIMGGAAQGNIPAA